MARNGFKILDCDLHVCEPIDLWQRYMSRAYRDDAPVGRPLEHRPFHDLNMLHRGETYSPYGRFDSTIEDEEAGFVHLARRHGRYEQFCEFQRRGWGPDTQIEAMDVEGIDAAVLFPSLALTAMGKEYDSDGLAAEVACAYNNWMSEFCAFSPKRLLGAGILLPQAINAAVAEVRRVSREFDFKAVVIRPNPVCGRNWHDPAYDPLWAACEEEQLLVGFHEGIPCLLPHGVAQRFDGRFEDDWMTDHVARHPHEMQYAILCVVMGGVLRRFPDLRFGFLEANCSWVPHWLWRMDEHYEVRGSSIERSLPLRPSEYFLRQCFVSVDPDEHTAGPVMDRIANNVVFSTDYMHPDCIYPHAIKTFIQGDWLTDDQKRHILWDNCLRMYQLDPDELSQAAVF